MRVLRGLLLLATFRAEGFAAFEPSRQAFLNSLAPLLAMPVVFTLLGLLQGGGIRALGDCIVSLIALLAPAVLSHAFARLWRVEAAWLGYVVAFNWCQWAVPLAGLVAWFAGGVLVGAGLALRPTALILLIALLGYGLALHYFLARRGLGLARGWAIVTVAAVNLLTGVLILGPQLVSDWSER